jgi:hypothetical protein
MPIQGDLGTLDVADLLDWVRRRARTGLARLCRGATEKRLAFDGGRLCAAWSNDPRETLGQALVRNQLVDEEELLRALLRQDSEPRLLGELLVQDGVLGAEQLRYALAGNAEEIACDVFLWADGAFTYDDGPRADGPVQLELGLDLGLVIEEGLHRREQWGELQRQLPSSEVRFRAHVAPDAIADPVERGLVALAAAGRTLASISLETRRSRYETTLRLHALVERGVLEPDPPLEHGRECDPVGTIQALLASAAELRSEKRYDAALALYDEVLALDRLDQEARKGRLAASEEQRQFKLAARLPHDKVPALRLGAVAVTRECFDSQEGFVLSRVNGQWSVGAILKLCPMPEADALAILLRLLERGVIELT